MNDYAIMETAQLFLIIVLKNFFMIQYTVNLRSSSAKSLANFKLYAPFYKSCVSLILVEKTHTKVYNKLSWRMLKCRRQRRQQQS